MDVITKEMEYEQQLVEKKSRFRMNVLEFIVGCVLLVFAFNYMKNHEAERVSIFAGIEVLVQKAEVFLWNVFGWGGDMIKEKHRLEGYYKELISTMKNGDCAWVETLTDATVKYNALTNMSASEYETQRITYEKFARTYKVKIDESCG